MACHANHGISRKASLVFLFLLLPIVLFVYQRILSVQPLFAASSKIPNYAGNIMHLYNISTTNETNSSQIHTTINYIRNITIKKKINSNPRKKVYVNPQQTQVCKTLLPDTIYSFNHHKTGHALSGKLSQQINRYCASEIMFTKPGCFVPVPAIQIRENVLFFHWLRPPLQTIISGYYYHLKADEKWVKKMSIHNSKYDMCRIQNNGLYDDVVHDNYTVSAQHNFTKYWQQNARRLSMCLVWNDINKHIDSKMYNMLSVHVAANKNWNKTLQALYRKLHALDYRLGLFYELLRYFNCEWPEMYILHEIAKTNSFKEYNIDSFVDNGFESNVNDILDRINLIDTAENRDKLQLNVKKNMINITKQREFLWEKLRLIDRKYASTQHEIQHVTVYDYDKKQVIEDFLSMDRTVCQLIKNMTIILDFEWMHASYC